MEAMNLGYPLDATGRSWGMEVLVGYDNEGRAKTMPLAFSMKQALEIARRINSFYGEQVEDVKTAS